MLPHSLKLALQEVLPLLLTVRCYVGTTEAPNPEYFSYKMPIIHHDSVPSLLFSPSPPGISLSTQDPSHMSSSTNASHIPSGPNLPLLQYPSTSGNPAHLFNPYYWELFDGTMGMGHGPVSRQQSYVTGITTHLPFTLQLVSPLHPPWGQRPFSALQVNNISAILFLHMLTTMKRCLGCWIQSMVDWILTCLSVVTLLQSPSLMFQDQLSLITMTRFSMQSVLP
jgi:hypothetical protein